jgi:hypothetical protein
MVGPQPQGEIAGFTYDKGIIYKWNGQNIAIPDQIGINETPEGHEHTLDQGNLMRTAREYQLAVSASVGLGVTDPETDITFTGDADGTNKLFRQTSTNTALQLHEALYDYKFLTLLTVNIDECLLPSVISAAQTCAQDRALIRWFFDTYGTHVVTSAGIGGKLRMRTIVTLNATTSKQLVETKINISVEAKAENEDYIKGGLKFDSRDENTSALYRDVSTKQIDKFGGDITAPTFELWLRTLSESAIPTQEREIGALRGFAAQVAGVQSRDSTTQNLGLIDMKYEPLPDVLERAGVIDKKAAKVWRKVLVDRLTGINPFENAPQLLAPDMKPSQDSDDLIVALSETQQTAMPMRGWFATYETYAGLRGLPGSRAKVKCKGDWDIGGWTTATIYAGERIQLLPKTSYLSGNMEFKFEAAFDDPNATVFAENLLVT